MNPPNEHFFPTQDVLGLLSLSDVANALLIKNPCDQKLHQISQAHAFPCTSKLQAEEAPMVPVPLLGILMLLVWIALAVVLCHWLTCFFIVCLFLSRDLSVDAGLPPHQYHIHPLPQHYQHYLTSPRMHHFPRNNASTQVVSLPPRPTRPHHVCLHGLPVILLWRMWDAFYPLPPFFPSLFKISSTELIPDTFICQLPGCPWDQKLPISPAALAGSSESQPLPPRICSSRELRGLCCYLLLPPLSFLTGLHPFIIVSRVTDVLRTVCSRFSYFQLIWFPDASNGPTAFNLMTFVFIRTRCCCFLTVPFLFLDGLFIDFIQVFHTSVCFAFKYFILQMLILLIYTQMPFVSRTCKTQRHMLFTL